MLLGLVFRGVAFEFQSKHPRCIAFGGVDFVLVQRSQPSRKGRYWEQLFKVSVCLTGFSRVAPLTGSLLSAW